MFLHGNNKDSDQTGQMPRLICLCWAHMSFCWFCRAAAQLCFHGIVKCNIFISKFISEADFNLDDLLKLKGKRARIVFFPCISRLGEVFLQISHADKM